MHAQPSEARYTVHLKVTVDGPEGDWEIVFDRLRAQVEKAQVVPFCIVAVESDGRPMSDTLPGSPPVVVPEPSREAEDEGLREALESDAAFRMAEDVLTRELGEPSSEEAYADLYGEIIAAALAAAPVASREVERAYECAQCGRGLASADAVCPSRYARIMEADLHKTVPVDPSRESE